MSDPKNPEDAEPGEWTVAVQGRPDCVHPTCTRINGVCVGWHCPTCDRPISSHGHDCPKRDAR